MTEETPRAGDRATSAKPELTGCRPFLIEDNPADVDLLVLAFERSGVPTPNVRVVRDGEEAVSVLAAVVRARTYDPTAQLPSFILLDLRLRRRPGLSVLEWIRSVPLLAAVPVMILTGTERPTDVQRARELGADSFYVKPLLFHDLMATAGAILTRWRLLSDSPGVL
jgi:CheY-like chemotaxis protein